MTQFSDYSLNPAIIHALSDQGIEVPTTVQAAAIPCFMEGNNMIVLAATGSGKTVAFLAPLLSQLSITPSKNRLPRGLVLVPTRELAYQVLKNFDLLAAPLDLTAALIIGGEGMAAQERKLKRGVDVIIATPGRLLDMWGQGKILLPHVRYLILDEADRMTDMGFYPDLRKIIGLLPHPVHYSLFSATMPNVVQELINSFVSDPAVLKIHNPKKTNASIDQFLAKVELDPSLLKKSRDYAGFVKRELLRFVLRAEKPESVIIFCNRKIEVAQLVASLNRHGFPCKSIHGDMEQDQRFESLRAFEEGTCNVLIASDVAARGLDIPNVSHVINYDIPKSQDDYIHRIGRTGRAGKSGRSITLTLSAEEAATLSSHVKDVIRPFDLEAFVVPEPGAEKSQNSRRAPSRAKKEAPKGAPLVAALPESASESGATPGSTPDSPSKSTAAPRRSTPTRAPLFLEEDPSPVEGFGAMVPSFMLVSPPSVEALHSPDTIDETP